MSERPNAKILSNQSLLTAMDIISYQSKQYPTTYIGEVLVRSGCAGLTVS